MLRRILISCHWFTKDQLIDHNENVAQDVKKSQVSDTGLGPFPLFDDNRVASVARTLGGQED